MRLVLQRHAAVALQGCVVAISCRLRTRSSASLTSLVIDTGSTETARTLPQPSVRRFVRTPIHACGSCGAPGAMQHCATLTVHAHKGTRNARGSLAAASRRGTSPAHSAQMGEQPTQRRAKHAQRKPRRPHAHGSPQSLTRARARGTTRSYSKRARNCRNVQWRPPALVRLISHRAS